MTIYNWQQKDWPNFSYKLSSLDDELILFAEKTGHVSGVLKGLPPNMQMDAVIDLMVAEAIKTSEIEGEYVSRKDVMSSIKNNLGLNKKAEKIKDKKADGIGELMTAVRHTFNDPLSKKTLFEWHKMLMADSDDVRIGAWRKHAEPMQVISGAIGKQKVHFEAPPSASVPKEMEQFIVWFNETGPGGKNELRKAPVRTAIAHLYFESIHPFEDGNGRIGRAIAEKALSQGLGRPVMLSLSQAIEKDKRSYYAALQKAQRKIEITAWLEYFVNTIVVAQTLAEDQIEFTLHKAKFFDRFASLLNDRQTKVIKRMLEAGPEGFEGGMNAGKYASLTKVSKATATRDLQDLVQQGALALLGDGGGRSTRYRVNL